MFKVKVAKLGLLAGAAKSAGTFNAKHIADAIRKSAFVVEAESKKAITIGKTRAILTGRLRSSISKMNIKATRAEVAPTVKYAIYVHEGTRFMRDRPFMAVGLSQSIPKIKKIFGNAIQLTLNSLGS